MKEKDQNKPRFKNGIQNIVTNRVDEAKLPKRSGLRWSEDAEKQEWKRNRKRKEKDCDIGAMVLIGRKKQKRESKVVESKEEGSTDFLCRI